MPEMHGSWLILDSYTPTQFCGVYNIHVVCPLTWCTTSTLTDLLMKEQADQQLVINTQGKTYLGD